MLNSSLCDYSLAYIQWRIQTFFGHTVNYETSSFREVVTYTVAPY